MPAPRTPQTQSVAPTADPRLMARASAPALRSPPTRDFVFLVSPLEMDMFAGEVLPRLIRFPIEAGLMGCAGGRAGDDESVIWRPAVAHECDRTGRLLVEPTRFGILPILSGVETRPLPGEDESDPRSWYVRRYRGHKGTIHVSLWQLPRVLGASVLWEHDRAGELDFRRQIAEKILGGVDGSVADEVRRLAESEAVELESEAKNRPRLVPHAEVARAALGKPKTTL